MYRDETKNLVEFPYKRVTLELTLGDVTNSETSYSQTAELPDGYTSADIQTAYNTGLPIFVRYKIEGLFFDTTVTDTLSCLGNNELTLIPSNSTKFNYITLITSNSSYISLICNEAPTFLTFELLLWLPA